jgi:hypothetical protein
MTTMMEVTNPAILLPVQDVILTICLKKDVKFVRVQLTINYSSLVNVTPAGATVLHAEYYLELPQTSRQMLDGNGNACNLLTFHGPSDICTMSTAKGQAQLLDVTF